MEASCSHHCRFHLKTTEVFWAEMKSDKFFQPKIFLFNVSQRPGAVGQVAQDSPIESQDRLHPPASQTG